MLIATVNSGAPFVASRGLVALHVTAAHRLPLFDMDIVHAGHELGGGGCLGGWPRVYRVLRPGALFWLDHLNYAAAQPNAMFAPLLDHVSDFASVSFWLPAHTSEHLHASDSDCSIMWAAAVTHKKFAARCGLPQQL